MAKAPVPGQVKTRLGATVGDRRAPPSSPPPRCSTPSRPAPHASAPGACVLALAGDLDEGVRGDEIARGPRPAGRSSPSAATASPSGSLNAHADAGAGPVVQVGMDTPQVTAAPSCRGRRRPRRATTRPSAPPTTAAGGSSRCATPTSAASLRGVPMSTPTTYDDTRAALWRAGSPVAHDRTLRDVDTVADADARGRRRPRHPVRRRRGAL